MEPFVSIIVPARNEEKFIALCLESIVSQDYAGRFFEILVVDGVSTDRTREIVTDFQCQYKNITMISNPRCIAPVALNLGLQRAKGEIIIRVDAHASIATDYVSTCVSVLESTHADCVGGAIISVNESKHGRAIGLAMSSPFGVGNSRFRLSGYEGYVDTLAFGAYKREVFEQIGVFDEELIRCQDDEFNYRLRKHGGKIYLTPKIRSWYYPRSDLRKLWKQYFQYGMWKIRVLQKHPSVMQPRQFVPPVFVLMILLSVPLMFFVAHVRWVTAGLSCLYSLIAVLNAFWLWLRPGNCSFLVLLASFPILHISYGLGFLCGLVKFMKRWGEPDSY